MAVLRTCLFVAAALFSGSAALSQSVDTRDLSVQQQAIAEIVAPNPRLRVTAWVDQEDNRYDIGEAIQLFVRVNEDAYITVVSVGPSGSAVVLYPNALQPGGKVPGGAIVQIPGEDAQAQIVASAPAGNELIKVIATSEPLEIVEPQRLVGAGAFRGVEGGAEQLARDLALAVEAEPQIAFYDKVIETRATGNAEIPVDRPPPAETGVAATRPAPLIAVGAPEYAVGDTVELAVTAMDDCNLWVVNLSSDRTFHLLFPNKLMRDNVVSAGRTVLISGGNSPVKVEAAGPSGKEAIYALCSEQPTPPWQAGVDFSQLFPTIDGEDELSRALIAMESGAAEGNAIPDIYAWSMTTLTVSD